MRATWIVVVMVGVSGMASCDVTPPVSADSPVDLPGVHNVVTYHDGFVAGGVPEGDAGFATLEAMGVRTVISVDGSEPEVELARARGMRYIHLPIGYSGFDARRKGELVRAVLDSMADGPVYLHCHHGKHRAAGAAATVAASVGWMTPDEGVARMKVSGTAPGYTGLYACAANAMVMSAAAIDEVPAEFPEVQRPKGLVATMVEIDEITDHLKVIAKAGWIVPADHPDLVPVAEAGRLADLLRVLHEGEGVKPRPAGYAAMMVSSAGKARAVEHSLVSGANRTTLDAQWAEVVASCSACHVAYRD